MHILLTDILSCPRCGAEHGLIVLADRLRDRHILEGRLGCANCREEYEVRDGVADLRWGPEAAEETSAEPAAAAGGEEQAYRLAALLGLGDAPAPALLLGVPAPLVQEVGRLLPHAQLVAVGRGRVDEGEGDAGVSWIRAGARLPFRDRVLRGCAVASGWSESRAGELARILAPGAHLVLDPAPPEAAGILRSRGFSVLLEDRGAVVASAP